jgi:hypothetical protein
VVTFRPAGRELIPGSPLCWRGELHRSVHRPGRCYVHELPDCTRDQTPNRHAGSIAHLPEFVSPSRAFRLGVVAIALGHQIGDAPDVDFRDHVPRLSGERLSTVNAAVWRVICSRADLQIAQHPYRRLYRAVARGGS